MVGTREPSAFRQGLGTAGGTPALRAGGAQMAEPGMARGPLSLSPSHGLPCAYSAGSDRGGGVCPDAGGTPALLFVHVELVVEGAAGQAEDFGEFDLGELGAGLDSLLDDGLFEGFHGLLEGQAAAADQGHEVIGDVAGDHLAGDDDILGIEEVTGQVGKFEAVAAGLEDEGLTDNVFEFADVAGAGLALEEFEDEGVDFADGLGTVVLIFADEVGDEQGDVFGALAERRDGQMNDVQALIEIETELAHGNFFLQRDVGGGDDADVDGLFTVGADGEDAFFLDDAEELGLEVQGQFGDLVEEDGALVGAAEVAGAAFGGAGEGPADVAEKFGFSERAGDGGTVDRDEGELGAFGIEVMDGFGDELFAGAGFAVDEDGGVGDLGTAIDLDNEVPHGLAGGHDADRVEKVFGVGSAAFGCGGGGLFEDAVEAVFPAGGIGVDEVRDAHADGIAAEFEGRAAVGEEHDGGMKGLALDGGEDFHSLGGGLVELAALGGDLDPTGAGGEEGEDNSGQTGQRIANLVGKLRGGERADSLGG